MGEGYRKIKPGEVPSGVQFGELQPAVGQLRAAFSTDQPGWGAAYRRLVNVKRDTVEFSRYYNTPDVVGEREHR
jgi:hypothetical protein